MKKECQVRGCKGGINCAVLKWARENGMHYPDMVVVGALTPEAVRQIQNIDVCPKAEVVISPNSHR